jgi:hypothetical protein
MSLAADDPRVAEVGRAIGPVLELIERGEAEAAALDFVENIALGPGARELRSQEERVSMVTNADTFVGEQRDPDWGRDRPCRPG